MRISDVRHQPRAHRILQRALSGQRLPHAYILHGPEGVGKQTLATAFGRLLLCSEPRSIDPPDDSAGDGGIVWRETCEACEDCRLTTAGTHPDFQVVHKALNRYHPDAQVRARKAIDLGVDVVRHFVIDRVRDRPARGRARVFVVLGADEMSVAAQNALLKTLEEPPGSAFLLLVTRSLDRLLATTRSRCQPVPFVGLPADFVAQCVRDRLADLPDDQVRFVSRYCDGRLGVALRLAAMGLFEIKTRLNQALVDLRQLGPSGFAQHVQQDVSALVDGYVAEMVEAGMIEKAGEAAAAEPTRRGLADMLALMSCLYRDVVQICCGRAESIVNAEQVDLVRNLADRMSADAAGRAIREIHRTEVNIANNANVPLALESLAIGLLDLEARSADRSGQAAHRTR